MIRGKVEGTDKLVGTVQKMSRKVFSETKKVLKAEAVLMTSHTRKTYMSGPRPYLLAVRSGNLRVQTKPLPVTERPGVIESGMGFGTTYARPHVGPKGQVTTIKPKKPGGFLAIPLKAAMKPSLETRGAPRSKMWGETFFARGEKGGLILFGKRVVQKGAHAGETRGKIVPLFLMVKQVKIKSRVHPEVILAWEKPRMIAAFAQIGIKLKGA
jgi:hypothetical protein